MAINYNVLCMFCAIIKLKKIDMKKLELEEKANEVAKLYYSDDDCERVELRDRIMEVVNLALNLHFVSGSANDELINPNSCPHRAGGFCTA